MRNDTFNPAAGTLVWWKRIIVGALCLRVAGGRLVAFRTALLVLAFQNAMQAQPAVGADTVLINGKIVTVDRQFSIAEAIAIRDGQFLAVGSNKQIEALLDRTPFALIYPDALSCRDSWIPMRTSPVRESKT